MENIGAQMVGAVVKGAASGGGFIGGLARGLQTAGNAVTGIAKNVTKFYKPSKQKGNRFRKVQNAPAVPKAVK